MNDERKKLNNQANAVYRLLDAINNILGDSSETDEDFKARIGEIREKIKVLLDELDERINSF